MRDNKYYRHRIAEDHRDYSYSFSIPFYYGKFNLLVDLDTDNDGIGKVSFNMPYEISRLEDVVRIRIPITVNGCGQVKADKKARKTVVAYLNYLRDAKIQEKTIDTRRKKLKKSHKTHHKINYRQKSQSPPTGFSGYS
jgi:hypothetical protein